MTATTTIEGRVAAAKDVTTPIDMFFAGRLQIAIPAGADSTPANESCQTLTDMHIVAEIPLLRSLGIRQTLTVIDPDNVPEKVFDASFDVHHVLYTSLDSDLLVAGNSLVQATCWYLNTTGVVVNRGESANDESCLLGVYRYPPKPATPNSPVECAMGIPV